MDSFLLDIGFSRCHSDNTFYTKKVGKSIIILVLYVDDLILTGSDPNLINHVKPNLKKQFEMTDFRHLHYFLGLQVLQSKEGISLSQSKYACDLLHQPLLPFSLESNFQSRVLQMKLMLPYTRQLVGKLLYLTHTRPDLSFIVGFIARFMENRHEIHWKVAKRILRYVQDYVFTLGSRPITQACKKQSAISLSSVEAEYRGAVEASKEAMWLRQRLSEFWLSAPTSDYTLV
eukprot:PITA_28645